MKMQFGKMSVLVLCVLAVLAVAGCGGGGGSSAPAGPGGATATISGTALAGTPLFGEAFLKDANGTKRGPVVIDKDGNFSFDVTGLQAPFILEADGTAGANSYRLCSMSTAGGTANINPVTNLAVAAATGKDPTAVFDDPVANNISSSINDAAIADAIAKIKAMLAPILDAYNASAVDPLKDTIQANNSGMDGVFDVVKINVTSDTAGAAQVSIDNKLTGDTILTQTSVAATVADATQTASTISAQTTGLSEDAANLQAIALQMQALATELNKGAAANIDSFVAVNFGINSGQDRAAFIAKFNPPGTITGISPLTVLKKTPNGTSFDYEIAFKAFFSDGSVSAPDDNLIFTNEGGVWKMKGNGFRFRTRIVPHAFQWIGPTSTTMKTGFQVQAEDPGNIGLASATITGPGLPAGGLNMTQVQLGVTFLEIDPAQQDNTLPTDNPDFFPVTDAAISTVLAPSSAPFTYTFTMKDANGAVIETRTWQLAAGPVASANLSAAFFPTISGFASHAVSLVAGQTSVTFNFTLPTAFNAQELEAQLNFFDQTAFTSGHVDSQPLMTATSVTLFGQTPAAPTNVWVSMRASDGDKRRFETVWIFQ